MDLLFVSYYLFLHYYCSIFKLIEGCCFVNVCNSNSFLSSRRINIFVVNIILIFRHVKDSSYMIHNFILNFVDYKVVLISIYIYLFNLNDLDISFIIRMKII